MVDEAINIDRLVETNVSASLDEQSLDIAKQVYDPFDPEKEIAKVLNSQIELPSSVINMVGANAEASKVLQDERAERLNNFKREFINQKKAIAELNIALYEQINDNPYIDINDLMALVNNYSVKGRFPDEYNVRYEDALNRRDRQYNEVQEFVSHFQPEEGAKLLNEVFGFEPEGDVEFRLSPVGVHFILHNQEDVRRTYYIDQTIERNDIEIRTKQYDGLKDIGGFALRTRGSMDSEGWAWKNSITVENFAWRQHTAKESEHIYTHETMHQVNMLFDPVDKLRGEWSRDWGYTDNKVASQLSALFKDENLTIENARPIMLGYVKALCEAEREKLNDIMRDEILARASEDEGLHDFDAIATALKVAYIPLNRDFINTPVNEASNQEKSRHTNFYKKLEDKIDNMLSLVTNGMERGFQKIDIEKYYAGQFKFNIRTDPEFQTTIHKVFGEDWETQIDKYIGYAKTIENSLPASAKEASYTMAILYTEPINKWRIISRVLSGK